MLLVVTSRDSEFFLICALKFSVNVSVICLEIKIFYIMLSITIALKDAGHLIDTSELTLASNSGGGDSTPTPVPYPERPNEISPRA